MKHTRDPNRWTNTEIAEDTEGYVAAQKAYREDRAEEAASNATPLSFARSTGMPC